MEGKKKKAHYLWNIFIFFTSCNLWVWVPFIWWNLHQSCDERCSRVGFAFLTIMQTPARRPDNRAAGWFMEMHLLHCRCLSVTEVADIPPRGRKSSDGEFRCRQGQWKQSASSCGPQLTRLRWSCEQPNFDNHTHTHTHTYRKPAYGLNFSNSCHANWGGEGGGGRLTSGDNGMQAWLMHRAGENRAKAEHMEIITHTLW